MPRTLYWCLIEETGMDHEGYCSGAEGDEIEVKQYWKFVKLADAVNVDGDDYTERDPDDPLNPLVWIDSGCTAGGSGYCHGCFRRFRVLRKEAPSEKMLAEHAEYQKKCEKIACAFEEKLAVFEERVCKDMQPLLKTQCEIEEETNEIKKKLEDAKDKTALLTAKCKLKIKTLEVQKKMERVKSQRRPARPKYPKPTHLEKYKV